MKNQDTLIVAMKRSLDWIESEDAALRSRGFEEIAWLASELSLSEQGEAGFFDYALFSARKHANDESEPVRASIVTMMAAICARSPWWHEAVMETADEIAAQPADAPKQVADAVRRQMEGA